MLRAQRGGRRWSGMRWHGGGHGTVRSEGKGTALARLTSEHPRSRRLHLPCPPPPPADPMTLAAQRTPDAENPFGRGALEEKGPQRRPQRRVGRRLEEASKAVGGGYCRLRMLSSLALDVRGTVAGHRQGALEEVGGTHPPFQCIPALWYRAGIWGGDGPVAHRRIASGTRGPPVLRCAVGPAAAALWTGPTHARGRP